MRKIYILWKRIELNLRAIVIGFYLSLKNKTTEKIIKGFQDNPHPEVSEKTEVLITTLRRITAAFKLARQQQEGIHPAYKIEGLWRKVIDDAFKELIQAINSEDFVSLNSLLSNFHRLPFSHATGGGFGDYNAYRKHPLLYRYLFSYQWHKYRKTYLDSSYDLNEIDWPSVGNPVGMQVNGHVWSADVFRYYYYANQFLELFGEKEHPVICEIGCGFGAVTYATLKKRKATYILVDIPESLIVSSYFLMTNFPNKKTLLFGEEDIGSINLEGFDMIFIPTYAIETLDDKTVDLFFNSNSFSEMKASSAKKYLDEIERICKKYFLHVNHTAEFTWKDENENEITNIKSTDLVPDKEFFRKKYQKKRIFSSVRDEIFYLQYKAEHFAFFYERIGT